MWDVVFEGGEFKVSVYMYMDTWFCKRSIDWLLCWTQFTSSSQQAPCFSRFPVQGNDSGRTFLCISQELFRGACKLLHTRPVVVE